MNTEYEIRVLEINQEEIIGKLEKLGAIKIKEYNQKRYVYDFNPIEESKWIRLRTNGYKTTLTIKEIKSQTIDGTKELEIEVSDFEKTNKILNELGYAPRAFQENKRVQYELDNVEIDIDSWPLIPTYLEIEGNSEKEVMDTLEKLELSKEEVTTKDVQTIYEDYGIDINNIKNLKFKEE